MRQEIWVRLAAPVDGGQREIDRRVKQLVKRIEHLMTVKEVKQVQVKQSGDETDDD
jgi:hypothetical protein